MAKANDEGMLLTTLKTVEELWVSTLQRAVGDPGLLGLHGRGMGLALRARELGDAWTEQWLRLCGVPSAAQMREALGLLQRVEDRVLRLEDRLAEQAPPAPATTPAPPTAPSAAAPPPAARAER